MHLRTLTALLLLPLLFGCSTCITVTSDPEGALITDAESGAVYGYAPVDAEFDRSRLEAEQVPGRCASVPGFTAKWPSGAEARSVSPVDVCDLRYGTDVRLVRPADAPGLEQDLRWALERAQRRARDAELERDRLQLYLDNRFFWRPGWGFGFPR
ncbi:MAG: hypothetical protein J6K46_06390 [Sutterella sp.]|nr:hypothetical protein [Sutterella sp.]